MKNIFVLSFLFVIAYSDSNAQVTARDFIKLQWLVGEWKRTNSKPETSGIEKWIKSPASELQGWGITMNGNDTAFVEKTKLIIKDNNIYYVADVPENKDLVYFKLTAITDHSFTAENPLHDFPKVISYMKDGLKLKATISGNGKSIEYLFDRKL